MKFGRPITTIRRLRKVRQKDLAAQLGIAPSSLSLIENDKMPIRLDLVEKIADILEVPVMFIVADALELTEREALPPALMSSLDSWRMDIWSLIYELTT